MRDFSGRASSVSSWRQRFFIPLSSRRSRWFSSYGEKPFEPNCCAVALICDAVSDIGMGKPPGDGPVAGRSKSVSCISSDLFGLVNGRSIEGSFRSGDVGPFVGPFGSTKPRACPPELGRKPMVAVGRPRALVEALIAKPVGAALSAMESEAWQSERSLHPHSLLECPRRNGALDSFLPHATVCGGFVPVPESSAQSTLSPGRLAATHQVVHHVVLQKMVIGTTRHKKAERVDQPRAQRHVLSERNGCQEVLK